MARLGGVRSKADNTARNGGYKNCETCGVTPPKNETHVDNIIPRSKGGDESLSNQQVLCRECNQEKERYAMTASTRIHFQLQQDQDGYPPVAVESIWATPGDAPNIFVLDNIPFFAGQATVGDVVKARKEDGRYWFDHAVAKSGNSLIRVVFFNPNGADEVKAWLVSGGCAAEYLQAHNLMAVNIPVETDLASIQQYLDAKAAEGVLDYEEPILRQ